MKLIHLIVILQLLVISNFAQEKEPKNFSDAKLELTMTDVKKNPDALEIEITLRNKSSNSILMVVPNIENGFKTNYFLGFNETNKILQIGRFLFLQSGSILDAPGPCYALFILDQDRSYSEKFSVSYPIAVNSYFLSNFLGPSKIDISKYSKINVQISLLPFDDDIYQIQNERPFGHCVMPEDKIENGIYKGRTLFEIQRILTADSK